MLNQVVTNQVGQQKGVRRDVADTFRNCEFLRMNPLRFTGSSVTMDPKTLLMSFRRFLRLSILPILRELE